MNERYQAVYLVKKYNRILKQYVYIAGIHDKIGKGGIWSEFYYNVPKKDVIDELRHKGVEVSEYVKNGGELRLV